VNDVPSSLVPGSRFAGYRIEEFLGAGGMAAVYRAYHEGMGREVALKVLAAALAGDVAFRRRFEREAHLVAKVEHPHIIPVYEADQEQDFGVPFIAMRLVRGGDLRAIVSREGYMTAGRAAAFVSPVASALDTAHEAGLVHRDVKPANMLVDVGRGRPEHVYLSDFGLARGVDTVGLSAGDLTTPGQFMGTPEYAAPEQITGGEVDGRADQYALGCVAYTLLTGSVPYPREQAIAVMYAQLYDPPPLVTGIRRDLPLAVNQVLGRAMEKKADDRYESCIAFADALREALDLPSWGSEGVRPSPRGQRNASGGQVPPGYSQTQLAPRHQGREPVQVSAGGPTSYDTRTGTWSAVVAADRDYYRSVWATDVSPEEITPFPEDSPVRRFPLSGTELLIGRRSTSKGIHPEIDLTLPQGGPLTDTGVSREHAKLVAGPDGNWSIVDLGTENGTLVNGREIPASTPIPLRHGDQINLGMWTVITITHD
jgi:serine/threonine protein kinase